jgi:hypothetical protein
MTLKNITMLVAMAAASIGIVGCDKLPTPEKMTTISTAVGKAAGYACELSKTKPEVKEAILLVLDTAVKVVPTEGQTFTEAWTPIVDEEVKKLVDAGKLDDGAAAVVKTAMLAATEGIDYIFVKYPKARDVKELVSAAVDGFADGFKSVVKLRFAAGETPNVDEEAYKYIKAKLAAAK